MLILSLIVLTGIAVRLLHLDDFFYSVFSDRLLWRAFHLTDNALTLGSESQFGGRVPGGFLYYWLRAWMLLGNGPIYVHAVAAAHSIASLAVLLWVAWRYMGPLAAMGSAACYAAIVSQAQLWDLLTLWNPSFAWLFGAVAYAAAAIAFVERSRAATVVFAAAITMAMQIHFSYSMLLLALLLAGLFFRRRPDPLSGLLFVAVLLALYTPYFMSELVSGFANFQNFVGHPLGATVRSRGLLEVWRSGLLEFLEGVLGFVPPKFDGGSTVLVLSLVRSLVTALVPAVLLAVGVGRLARVWRGSSREISDTSAADFIKLNAFVLAAALCITLASPYGAKFRYVAFAIPAASFVFGFALARIIRFLRGPQRAWPHRLAEAALALWVLAAAAANTIVWEMREPAVIDPALRYDRLAQVIGTAHRTFGFGEDRILDTVLILTTSQGGKSESREGRWRPVSVRLRGASYVVRRVVQNSKPQRWGHSYDSCLAVLLNPSSRSDPSAEAREFFHGHGIMVQVREQVIAMGAAYVSYTSVDGNCLGGLRNRYVPTPEERKLAIVDFEGRRVRNLEAGREIWLFGLVPDGPVEVRLAIGLQHGEHGTTAVLIGNFLRGFDGLLDMEITNPRLVFRGVDGEEIRLPIFQGRVGGEGNLVVTPWRSAQRPIPPGRYQLAFAADRLADRSSGLRWPAPNLVLASELVVGTDSIKVRPVAGNADF